MKKQFDDELHTLSLSDDGSYTAYSKEYGEHYHSTKDGALQESLKKHIIPAFELVQKDEVHILDICFGLGLNTLGTIYYTQKYFPNKKLYIYSPELDEKLISSLEFFTYPKEFKDLKKIITALSQTQHYEDERVCVEVFLGDAREYVKRFSKRFDIVYQDAFSPSANPMLWTQEYFADIKNAMKKDGILTTYSTALKTRLALHNNNFLLYLNKGEGYRNATVATLQPTKLFEAVDMAHKISCNPDVKPLRDAEL